MSLTSSAFRHPKVGTNGLLVNGTLDIKSTYAMELKATTLSIGSFDKT